MKYPITATLSLPPIEAGESAASVGALRFLKEQGFDGADLSTYFLDLSDWRRTYEAVAAAREEAGLPFLGSHLPFYGAALDRNMYAAIDLCAALKIPVAVIHPPGLTKPARGFDVKRECEEAYAYLAPYRDYAQGRGLLLAVENMRLAPSVRACRRFCQSAEEVLSLAERLDTAVCWDTGHGNSTGCDQEGELALLGKRLRWVHINDNTGIDDDHLPPFEGNVDFAAVARGLSKAGYTGAFNYEIAASRVPASLRAPLAAYLVAAAKEILK